MLDYPFQAKIEAKKLPCRCWDCLRAAGITPRRHATTHHRDILGREYRSDNGKLWARPEPAEEPHVEAALAAMAVELGVDLPEAAAA